MFLKSYPHSQGRWSIFRAVCRSMVVSASCCNLVVGVVGVAASWSVLQSRGRHGFCCKIMVGDISVADPWSTWLLLQNHGRLDFFLQNHGWHGSANGPTPSCQDLRTAVLVFVLVLVLIKGPLTAIRSALHRESIYRGLNSHIRVSKPDIGN